MSFFVEKKFIFGAVGLAVSSAALGFVLGRFSERLSPGRILADIRAEDLSPLAEYMYKLWNPGTSTSQTTETGETFSNRIGGSCLIMHADVTIALQMPMKKVQRLRQFGRINSD